MALVHWLLVVTLAAWGQVAEAFTAVGAAVDEPAARGVQVAVGAGCDTELAAAIGERHPEVRQLVLTVTDSFAVTSGSVEVVARDATGDWVCQTSTLAATFGRNGTRPLPDRVSGDGTTPAGVFPLGVVEAWDGQVFSLFGNRPDPGAIAPYRDVRPEDCWGATPNTARYQHLVNRPGCAGPHDEWLPRFGDAYEHAAVIGANLDPISGDEPGETPFAAAIFLHRDSYLADGSAKPTSGCVSLAHDDLVTTVRLLDPRLDPHFAIGPRDWLLTSG